jgi:hypothetical protein
MPDVYRIKSCSAFQHPVCCGSLAPEAARKDELHGITAQTKPAYTSSDAGRCPSLMTTGISTKESGAAETEPSERGDHLSALAVKRDIPEVELHFLDTVTSSRRPSLGRHPDHQGIPQ